MNTKRKGNKNERKTRDRLYDLGYDYVQKAGGSLGLFDLIALGQDKHHILLVQVKSNYLPGPKERDRIASFQLGVNNFKEIWVWKDRNRIPRRRLWLLETNEWVDLKDIY